MNSKIVIFKLHPFEHKGFEEYLENQALKGWKLKSAYGAYLKFKKITPQRLKYSVEILNEVTYFDGENSELSLDFREYCKEAGWEFICEMEKFQIFCHDGEEEILPINTEEDIKFKNICKASLKSLALVVFIALVMSFNIFSQYFLFVNPYAFASNVNLILGILIIMTIRDVVSFICFYVRGKKSLNLNEKVRYSGFKDIKVKRIIDLGSILIAISMLFFMLVEGEGIEKSTLIIMGVFVFASFILWKWLGRRDYKREKKKGIAIAGYVILTVLMFFGILFTVTMGVFSTTEGEDNDFITESYERKSEGFLATYVFTIEYEEFRGRYEWVNKYYFKDLMERSNSYGDNVEKVEINNEKNFEIYKVGVGGRYLVYSPEVVISFDNYEKMLNEDEVIKLLYKQFIE